MIERESKSCMLTLRIDGKASVPKKDETSLIIGTLIRMIFNILRKLKHGFV